MIAHATVRCHENDAAQIHDSVSLKHMPHVDYGYRYSYQK